MGISEAIFYGDLVYHFKEIVGIPTYQKITKRYERAKYSIDRNATIWMLVG